METILVLSKEHLNELMNALNLGGKGYTLNEGNKLVCLKTNFIIDYAIKSNDECIYLDMRISTQGIMIDRTALVYRFQIWDNNDLIVYTSCKLDTLKNVANHKLSKSNDMLVKGLRATYDSKLKEVTDRIKQNM